MFGTRDWFSWDPDLGARRKYSTSRQKYFDVGLEEQDERLLFSATQYEYMNIRYFSSQQWQETKTIVAKGK